MSGVALVNVVLGLLASEAARQRDDPRLFLVSMALLVSSGFLALHALATPGVVLHEPNAGFVIATPIGLLLASGFAAASAVTLSERATARLRAWQGRIRLLVAVVLLLWAAASLSGLSPLDRAPEEERVTWVLILLPLGVIAYGFAAVRYVALYRRRGQILPLAVAFILLAEALIAVAFGRAWHASWWEWHVLMAIAFGAILLAVRHEYRRERSLPEAFGGLYAERTLERLDDRRRSALLRLTEALRTDHDPDVAMRSLREEGFSGEEIAVLERAAEELARVDGLLHRYLGPQLARQLHLEPSFGDLGGREREVTALFADLVVHVVQRGPRGGRGRVDAECVSVGSGARDRRRRGRRDRAVRGRRTARDLRRARGPARPRAPGRTRRPLRSGSRGRPPALA